SCHHRALHSFPTRRSSDLHRVSECFRCVSRLLAVGRIDDERRLRERTPRVVETEGADRVLVALLGALRDLRLPLRELFVVQEQRSEEHTSELQSLTNLVCR